MKRHVLYAIIFLAVAVLLLSCVPKKTEQSASSSPDSTAWPELESFHMVMAEAYHPYQDSKNLEPVKSLAENLAKEAEKWAKASLPDKVNNEVVKGKLEKLKADSRKLADLVKSGGTDAQIGESLAALHGTFHSIMEEWH